MQWKQEIEDLKSTLSKDLLEPVTLAVLQAFAEISKVENRERERFINAVNEDGWTSLHEAAFKGHTSIIQWLLSASGGRAAGFNSFLARDNYGQTALHLACARGHLECVLALVEGSKVENGEREALINAVDKNGRTALYSASFYGYTPIIRWLLSDSGGRAAGFDSLLTKDDEGVTALHLACEKNHLQCVLALVEGSKIDNGERAALINAVDKHGRTALYSASWKGHISIIRWLLSDSGGRAAGFKGPLVKAARGATALHLACEGGRLECVLALVEDRKVDNGEREAWINTVDEGGWTVLHDASLKGHASIVRWLLSDSGGRAAGFNSLLAKLEAGETALHLACEKNHLECVQALVECSKIDNGEREDLINAVEKQGMTALDVACLKGHVSIVRWLLSDSGGRAAGFKNLLTKNNNGQTALHVACRYGNLACVQAVVEGSKIDNGEREELLNAIDENGWSVLHIAAHRGRASIIRWLVSETGGRAAGFNSLLVKAKDGQTVLHFACHLECAQTLVEGSKIDSGEREELLNAVDKHGWTVLHYAACRGHLIIIRWLSSDSGGRAAGLKSSTITAKTIFSESTLHLALQSGSVDVLQALLSGCTSAERMNLFLIVDNRGWTALHHAARYGRLELIRELLHHPETQMIVDHRDHRGMTALHRAVIEGLDDESREEWRTYVFGMQSREETIAALLTTPSSGEESQQAAQVDPNVGLKFD